MTQTELLDTIRRKIERQSKSIEDATGDFAEGRRLEQRIILAFLDTLQEPSLPSDVDEAAGEYLDGHKPLSRYNWGDLMDAFKAGAEWGEKNAYKAIMKKADEVREKRFYTDFEVKFEPAAGFDLGCVNVYHEGKLVGQYVEPKEEKKLPEGLDEAAEKLFPEKRQYVSEFGTIEYVAPWVSSEKAAFKAGAEWMAGQGETVEGEIVKDISNRLAVTAKGLNGSGFNFGDKVIVQIRKK